MARRGRPKGIPGKRIRNQVGALEKSEFTENQIRKLNEARAALYMKPLNIIKRKCLRCDALFLSQGSGHRACNPCNNLASSHTDLGVSLCI